MVCGAGKNIWTPPRNSGRIPSTRFSVSMENEQADKRRYSQTCLAKPNSQARTGARKFSPVQLTINRIGNLTQLICTLLYVMTTHTCIRILYCRVYPQPPACYRGTLGFKEKSECICCGHASGIFSPRPLWFGGCATHATPCSVPGYSYFRMCLEKSEHKLLVQCSNPREFFFLFACLKACFRLSLSTRSKKKRTITSKKHAYRPETSYVL